MAITMNLAFNYIHDTHDILSSIPNTSICKDPCVGASQEIVESLFGTDTNYYPILVIGETVFRVVVVPEFLRGNPLSKYPKSLLVSKSEYERIRAFSKVIPIKRSDIEATKAVVEFSLLGNEEKHLASSKKLKQQVLEFFAKGRVKALATYEFTNNSDKFKVTFKDFVKPSHNTINNSSYITSKTKLKLRKSATTPLFFQDKRIDAEFNTFTFLISTLHKDLKRLKVSHAELKEALFKRLDIAERSPRDLFLGSSYPLTINNVDYIAYLDKVSRHDEREYHSQKYANKTHYISLTAKANINFECDKAKIEISKPSLLNETVLPFLQTQQANFNDFLNTHGIMGLPPQLGQLIDAISDSLDPIKALKMQMYQIRRQKGVLLYGMPGTGKTTIAHLIKKFLKIPDGNYNCLAMTQVLGEYVGETEKNIRALFEKAKSNPSSFNLLVLDEVDAIGDREKTKVHHESTPISQLLTLMDGEKIDNIVVIGLTNYIQKIDKALLRPGRFDAVIEIPLPDDKQREQIFEVYLKPLRTNGLLDKDVDLKKLASITQGGTGADIEGVVNNAKTCAYQKDSLVTMDNLIDAISNSSTFTRKRKRSDENLTYFL